MSNSFQNPEYLDFEGSIDFQFNTPELATHFSNHIQPGLQGQTNEWPGEFTLGDYPWDRFKINSVNKHGRVVRVHVIFRTNNVLEMPKDDFENAVLEDLESLEGVDTDDWEVIRARGKRLEQPINFSGGLRRIARRKQKGGETLPMPAPYLGKISGMVQPNAPTGQNLALPNLKTGTVRPFLPTMGGNRRKGGFVPSIMEPFAKSAAQYATPMAIYAGYKLLTRKTPRKTLRKNTRKTLRKTRRT